MNPLDEIWAWYEAARDSLHLALRVITSTPSAAIRPEIIPRESIFQSAHPDEVTQRLQKASQELDDLAIVALWASFEQQVLDHVEQVVSELSKKEKDRLQRSVLKERLKKPRYWHFEEVLNIYKAIIDPQLVGDVKQVLQYRNWVAHGRTSPMPPNIVPRAAYERLKDFLDRLKP